MVGQLNRMLARPEIGPEIDPRMEPSPKYMLGVTPPNDRMVVDPAEIPTEQEYKSYRYGA
jgi:hypothetical protein